MSGVLQAVFMNQRSFGAVFNPAGALSFSATLLGTLPQETGGSQSVASPRIAQPEDNSFIIASSNRNSVYRSTTGSSWTQTYDGTESSYNYGHGGIFVKPDGSSVVASPHGSNFGKVIYSSNGGQTWSTVATTNDSVYPGDYDPATGVVLFGTRKTNEIIRSSNYGASFTQVLSAGTDVYNVAKVKGSNGAAVAWTSSTYYTSSDGGQTWGPVQATPSNHAFSDNHYARFNSSGKLFYIKASNEKNILSATTSTGSRTSTALGSSGNARFLNIDPLTAPNIIYVGTSSGEIYFSTNSGTSYSALTAFNTVHTSGGAVTDISTASSSGRFLVATQDRKVYALQRTGTP